MPTHKCGSLPPKKQPPDPLTRVCKVQLTSITNLDQPPTNNVYYVKNTNVIYSTLNAQQRNKKGALVDRGANGGIAGSDTCIINTHPAQKVAIQGIDNHHLPDISIVTVGAIVRNQRDKVILAMN